MGSLDESPEPHADSINPEKNMAPMITNPRDRKNRDVIPLCFICVNFICVVFFDVIVDLKSSFNRPLMYLFFCGLLWEFMRSPNHPCSISALGYQVFLLLS